MAERRVLVFPATTDPAAASAALASALDQHVEAFRVWLLVARPTRDDALLQAEEFAATARQLAQRHTAGGA